MNDFFKFAALYARQGKFEKMIDSLKRAVVSAKSFDSRPDISEASYVLLGNKTYGKTDYETES